MSKEFNITGLCFADEHYMADVSKKLEETINMVEKGQYFIINRPRQYGKTTTLYNIAEILEKSGEYLVFNISFEGIGDLVFQSEEVFAPTFLHLLQKRAKNERKISDWLLKTIPQVNNLNLLSDAITDLASKTQKKLVILIDEVDKSSNNQLFVSFLAMLRNLYLDRKRSKTFHSVVLAGVHDVKSLKVKIRPDEEQKYNSPWNIASDFKVDMNLLPHEIKPMLDEYSADKSVKMDTQRMADRLFYYTSGYPFLVSKLCKMMDEEVLPTKTTKEWTEEDLELVVRQVIGESNSNFDTLTKNLENNENLYKLAYNIVIENEIVSFNAHDPTINLGILYGIFVNKNGLAIHNRIYREVIINYMTSRMHRIQLANGADFGSGYTNPDKKSLNMEVVLRKFQAFMREQYSRKDRDFLERNGRLVFLAFMKPIINGSGYDFKEPQISEERRLDVTITFYQHKYVAELKIWRGKTAHEEGLNQLADYLDTLGLTEGYLLIFDHAEIKSWNTEWVEHQGKKIFIAWV